MQFKKKLKDFFALKRNIVVFIIANIFWATIILYKNFLPKFYESLGADIFIVGVLFSLSDLFYGLASFIGGHLGDAYGRKHIFVRAAFLGSFFLLGYYFAPNWLFLLPFLVLRNFTFGIEDAPAQTLISESLPKKQRATGLGSIYLSATIAAIVLAPLGALLVQNYGALEGVRLGVLISFVFCLFGNAIFLFYGREIFKRKSSKVKFNFSISNAIDFLKKLPSPVKAMLIFISLLYFSGALILPYWIFYALDIIKIDSLQFGLLTGFQAALVAVFMFLGAKLSDRHGRKKILLASCIISLVALIMFVFSRNFIDLLIVYALGGISTIGSATVFPYITENTDPKIRSKSIGMLNGFMTLASIPAPFVGSLLYAVMPQYPFLFSGIILLAGLIIGAKFLK
jgi:MFS family permease